MIVSCDKNSTMSPTHTFHRPATIYLQNNGELEYGAGFARESYDRSFRFVFQLDHLS